MLMINLTLGIMSRTLPQLNLFSLGFAPTALNGVILFAVFIPNMIKALTAVLTASLANL